VIVKVQRPGIVGSVNRDLDVLDELASMVEQCTAWGAEYHVSDLADEFGDRLREELDFEIEARNASDIAANLPGADHARRHAHDLSSATSRCSAASG
jgi:ubiquinone biosynthesis protein